MGGGDLNLKKSWHPHTLKNQKRVYEAEQANAAEKRKLQELQREIQHERNFEELKRIGQNSGVLATDDSKRLEWMYKGGESSLNREEYLMGRSVDKHFEDQDKVEKQKEALVGVTVPKNHVEHECIPFSIRAFKDAPVNEEQVDLQRKIMEDPLMMIQQREMETRKKLLENPVKLKEIHRLLQADKKLKESSSSHKKKKKSKKSKKKRSHSDSQDSDEDLDSQLAKKYKKLLGENDEKSASMSIDKLLNEKYEKLTSELDKIKKSNKKDKKNKKKKRNSSSSSSSESDSSVDVSKHKNIKDTNDSKRSRYFSPPQNKYNERQWTQTRNDRGRNDEDRHRHGNAKRRSISPRHNERDRQSERRPKSRSPIRKKRSESPIRGRKNRSPVRDRRSRSPVRDRRSRSPVRDRRSRSPIRNRKSPIMKRKIGTPDRRKKSRTPNRDNYKNSRSPHRNRKSRSPVRRKRSESAERYRTSRRYDEAHSKRRENNRRHDDRKRSRSRSRSPNRKERRESQSRSRSRSKRTNEASKSGHSQKRTKSPEKLPLTMPNKHIDEKRTVQTEILPSRKSTSSSSSSSDSDADSDNGKAPLKHFGLVTASGEKIELERKNDSKNAPIVAQKKPTSTFVPPSQPKKKLTDEEKEARLREMQKNAKWHDQELYINRKRNEERAKHESEQEKTIEFDRNYIHKEMHKALNNQDSVEARLKSNKNNIQRTSSSMHSHFAKK